MSQTLSAAEKRSALKSAITSHPDWKDFAANSGAKSNALTMNQLLAIAGQFRIDVAALIGAAAATAATDSASDSDISETEETSDAGDKSAAPIPTVLDQLLSDIFHGDIRDLHTRASTVLSRIIVECETHADRADKHAATAHATAEQLASMQDTIKRLSAMRAGTASTVTGASAAEVPVYTDSFLCMRPATEVFGMRHTALQGLQVATYAPDMSTKQVDKDFKFDVGVLRQAIVGVESGTGCWAHGPAATGKTTFWEQYSARTGRPYVCLSFGDGLESAQLVGMMINSAGGVTTWRDGAFVAGIRKPGTLLSFDEPTLARPGILPLFNAALAQRYFVIADTGECVTVADRVAFVCADNTRGFAERANYVATNNCNIAFLSRFPIKLGLEPMSPSAEAKIIAVRSGAPLALCTALATFANLTRTKAVGGQGLSEGINLRALIAGARLLHAGIAPADVFVSCLAGNSPPEDIEALHALRASHFPSDAEITALARGQVPTGDVLPATQPENALAQDDFNDIEF